MKDFQNPEPSVLSLPDEGQVMVLLVDDQPMIGEAIRRSLASQPDIAFHYCSDPEAAVALAAQIQPTVILQDLVLPGVDGLTLVRQYRGNRATQDTPIIVLSTKEEPAVKSEAFKAGANDYLVKLPDPIELIARICYHSKAFLLRVQRDEAYLKLHKSQQQLMEANIELQRLTKIDGLTGLSNRRYFNDYVEGEWRRAIREKSELSALMIDVDDFKRYNDGYGHLAGDEVLKQLGTELLGCFMRPADLAARFGGEEFVVLLPGTPLSGAKHLADQLLRNFNALQIPHETSSTGKFVTLSIGVASASPEQDSTFHLLVDAADQALYEAKRSGKNRVVAAA